MKNQVNCTPAGDLLAMDLLIDWCMLILTGTWCRVKWGCDNSYSKKKVSVSEKIMIGRYLVYQAFQPISIHFSPALIFTVTFPFFLY